ncbi:hypothetical protein FRB99_006378 [Tulasnella sp. 403]|nr:hypothetical protein FRB99_006378 [Tulasnella sp. 403]
MPAPPEGYDTRVTTIYPGIAPERFQGIHKGKVVFITGGGVGLGLAAAKAFLRSGAKVFISGRRVAPLEAAKAEIEAAGGEVDFARIDVTDPDSVKSDVAAAVQKFGRIDIVVANAGRTTDTVDQKIAEFDIDDWWGCVEASLKGSFLTVHVTLPELLKSGDGYIILLSSSLAQYRLPGGSPYNIAKHALNRLAEWIDIEYRDQGIKAFAVNPGNVATDLGYQIIKTSVLVEHGDISHSPDLSGWTYVRLTSGSEDWLSGRFVDVTWNLDEMVELKEKILEQDALKNRLALPI